MLSQGVPGGSVVKHPPAKAGDLGSISWSGKIPHATRQLSLGATTTESVLWSLGATAHEPQLLQPVVSYRWSHGHEKPTHRNQGGAPACRNERKAHTATKTNTAKNKQVTRKRPSPFSEVIWKGTGDRKSTVTKGNFYLLVTDARNQSSFSHFWLTKFAVYNVRESWHLLQLWNLGFGF